MTLPEKNLLIHEVVDRFWDTLPPTWSQVRDNLHHVAMDRFAISVEQLHILRHVQRGVTSVSDLADARYISRPAVSQAVDLLVEKGCLTRTQSAQDRRFVELALTASGAHLLETIFRENGLWMAEKLARLSNAELDSLSAGLEMLHKAFNPPTR